MGDTLLHPMDTPPGIDTVIMDMLPWTDMLTMDTLLHPTATLPGIDTVIMDMLPWTDMPTMDTLRHPTPTLPGIDMRILDTRLPPTTTPQGSDTALSYSFIILLIMA